MMGCSKLKPREQEVILETKAEHVNEDFSHMDLVGAIYTERWTCDGSDGRGDECAPRYRRRAIMPSSTSRDAAACGRSASSMVSV